jgi:hypothetical protein
VRSTLREFVIAIQIIMSSAEQMNLIVYAEIRKPEKIKLRQNRATEIQ